MHVLVGSTATALGRPLTASLECSAAWGTDDTMRSIPNDQFATNASRGNNDETVDEQTLATIAEMEVNYLLSCRLLKILADRTVL